MLAPRLTDSAQEDLEGILVHSEVHFGPDGRERYEALVTAGLTDIAQNPKRPGSLYHPNYGKGVRSWHLRLSREHVPANVDFVHRPRHKLFYRVEDNFVWIGRILHEKMDPIRHLSFAVWSRRFS